MLPDYYTLDSREGAFMGRTSDCLMKWCLCCYCLGLRFLPYWPAWIAYCVLPPATPLETDSYSFIRFILRERLPRSVSTGFFLTRITYSCDQPVSNERRISQAFWFVSRFIRFISQFSHSHTSSFPWDRVSKRHKRCTHITLLSKNFYSHMNCIWGEAGDRTHRHIMPYPHDISSTACWYLLFFLIFSSSLLMHLISWALFFSLFFL